MFFEILLYEGITTIGGLLGLKAISMVNVNHQLQGIKQSKNLPIIDKYLKGQVGSVSKREDWLARKAVTTIQRMSHYQALKYVLILVGRKARDTKMAKSRSNHSLLSARGQHTSWPILLK